MLSLHTNNAALSAQSSIGRTQGGLSTSMTRLSTGFRINSAADDAAGLQIATRLKAQTSGMAVAMRNTQNATSMIQTAGGALAEIKNMLIRMKDLATQGADGSSSDADIEALNTEFTGLKEEIANILGNTTFGGTKLLSGTGFAVAGGVTFQIGATSDEKMNVDVSDNVLAIADDADALDMETDANAAIDAVQLVIDTVSTVDSALGGAANRLAHVNNNLSNISSNTKAAIGRIMDTDFATESANMTKNQMLTQAGTAMLKQSNQMSQMVMSLLQ